MIYLIVGRPRSGKSYEAVKYHVIPSLKSGRKVITNLPLDIEHITKIHGAECASLVDVVSFDYSDFNSNAVTFPFSKPEHYSDEWRNDKGVGPLYVIDEAHFSLPKGGTHSSVKKYFTMHGHYGVDILLMTQHQRQLDTDILNLVEVVYRTIKNTALGSTKTYTKKVQDGNRGAVVNTEQRRYDSAVFPYYKSHTQSSGDVLEREASDIKPIWKHWSIYLAIPCFLFVAYQVFTKDVNPFKAPEKAVVEDLPVKVLEPPVVSDVKFKSGVKTSSLGGSDVDYKKPNSESTLDDQLTKGVKHPFYRVQLHVSGFADIGTRQHPKRLVYFSASRNGNVLFELQLRDLLLAGYDVSVLGECLVHLNYGSYKDFLTCDTPTIGVDIPSGGVDV